MDDFPPKKTIPDRGRGSSDRVGDFKIGGLGGGLWEREAASGLGVWSAFNHTAGVEGVETRVSYRFHFDLAFVRGDLS